MRTDYELIKEFQEGKEAAFNELVDRYLSSTYGFFTKFTDSKEEAEDLVRSFELALKRRRTGDIVRLEILEKSDKELIKFILNKLEINPNYIYEVAGLVGIQDIDQICKIKNSKLKFKNFTPRDVESCLLYTSDAADE